MKFQNQSYRSNSLRPTPEVFLDDRGDLLIAVTPWGQPESAKKIIQLIHEYMISAKDDSEVTSPFEILTCLSPLANDIRTALLLANEAVFRSENREEFISGAEVLVVARSKTEVSIGQVGNPSVFLKRKNLGVMPLTIGPDNFSTTPLPLQLLGVDSMISPNISSLKVQPADQFIFLSRSQNNAELIKILEQTTSINEASQAIVRIDSEIPFWIGSLLNFKV